MSQREQFLVRLGQSQRDRRIAAWIDGKIAAGENVSEAIKNHLYVMATGQGTDLDQVVGKLEEIERLLRSGAVVSGAASPVSEGVNNGEAVISALLNMRD